MSKSSQAFSIKRIPIFALFPIDPDCRQFFLDSGVPEYLKDLKGRTTPEKGKNLIVRVGTDKTDNEKIGLIIRKAMQFLTGTESHYPPVFSIVQEMCSNSVEHSNSIRPNWLFGVSYEGSESEVKTVRFTMTDVGSGILKTLNRKFSMQILESVSSKNEIDILHSAFERKYGSKTLNVNRNKGLPLILNRVQKQLISNMKVVTNNVVLHLERKDISFKLKRNLQATFYTWSINLENVKRWKTQVEN